MAHRAIFKEVILLVTVGIFMHTRVESMARSAVPSRYLFLGNPGSGKSTLCNAMLGENKFRSGISGGSGLTTAFQWASSSNMYGSEIIFGDGPGLADAMTRDNAAREITELLKSGGEESTLVKLIFVITLESGRVKPQDTDTMDLVLDAVTTPENPKPKYGVIINKVSKNAMKRIRNDKEFEEEIFESLNANRANPTLSVHFYEELQELKDADNVLHEPTNELKLFLLTLPPVEIKASKVRDVHSDKSEESTEKDENEKAGPDRGVLMFFGAALTSFFVPPVAPFAFGAAAAMNAIRG